MRNLRRWASESLDLAPDGKRSTCDGLVRDGPNLSFLKTNFPATDFGRLLRAIFLSKIVQYRACYDLGCFLPSLLSGPDVLLVAM